MLKNGTTRAREKKNKRYANDVPKKKYNFEEDYVCSICEKKHVKLWRPYGQSNPLICAVCAEERQRPYEYEEVIWIKDGYDGYMGKHTGKKLPLPKWVVDETGRVPSYQGPGPEGKTRHMTDHLLVTLDYGNVDMIPAVPDEDGNFWCYTTVPESFCKWWNNLPTR